MTRRRLILYLLLNAFVSALVTGTILFLYDRFGRPESSNGVGTETGVIIAGVTGAGVAESEAVTLQNTGEQSVVLTGWTLRDSDGAAYTLPQLTLYPGGAVQVHTANGENSVTDLYWGLSSPLWEPGELVVLYDTQGLARAFYRIP
ncbi:MAG: lamin tail domain-containing protein [Chloroflexi bacterium]|nr:lamin tail domain-containing protein [Chloroflexota bacterium]